MGWIRQLVTFTESQPVFTSEPRSSNVEYDPDAGFQRTVFPSLNPSRREDVALLEHWMLAMMDQITAALPKHLRSDPNKVPEPDLAHVAGKTHLAAWLAALATNCCSASIPCSSRFSCCCSPWHARKMRRRVIAIKPCNSLDFPRLRCMGKWYCCVVFKTHSCSSLKQLCPFV